jgi:tyrosinase
MNYDRYTKDPKNSALFNGNMTSMGGNGEPDPKYPGFRTGPGQISSGGGGGCVTTGPFKEFVFHTIPTVNSSKNLFK